MKTTASLQVPKKNVIIGEGIKNTAKIFAVGVLALLAIGFCTTSQRLNAG